MTNDNNVTFDLEEAKAGVSEIVRDFDATVGTPVALQFVIFTTKEAVAVVVDLPGPPNTEQNSALWGAKMALWIAAMRVALLSGAGADQSAKH
jgi:hypothetical protein